MYELEEDFNSQSDSYCLILEFFIYFLLFTACESSFMNISKTKKFQQKGVNQRREPYPTVAAI